MLAAANQPWVRWQSAPGNYAPIADDNEADALLLWCLCHRGDFDNKPTDWTDSR
jgi:hypothetical protein